MWHIRSDRFKNCPNKASHVGKDKILGDKKVDMKNYIKKVRRTCNAWSRPSGVRPNIKTPLILNEMTESGASTITRGNMNVQLKFLLDDPAEVQENTFTRKASVIPCNQDNVIVDWSSGVF